MQTVIGIKIATATKTAIEMQVHRRRVPKDNIPSKTPAEDGLASEIKTVV